MSSLHYAPKLALITSALNKWQLHQSSFPFSIRINSFAGVIQSIETENIPIPFAKLLNYILFIAGAVPTIYNQLIY